MWLMNSKTLSAVLAAAIESGRLGESRPLAAFVDLEGVEATIVSLKSALPPPFEHAFAAKANPMREALRLVHACGMQCEVASPGELEQALKAGFTAAEIVYDEPTKTEAMLARALQLGIHLNMDNLQEFERVRAWREQYDTSSMIGFRVNPQVGAGGISAFSTATDSSKFGVPLRKPDNRGALRKIYLDHPWLTALHCHVGSQGCSLDLIARGVAETVRLAEEINGAAGRRQVSLIDIGGGLPVNFESEEVRPTFAEYAAVLREMAPQLFTGTYRVKTEFGRSVLARHGVIVSRVEYTKEAGGRRVALAHAGAQVATRTVFMPEDWPLRISVFDASGRPKSGPCIEQDVAGPLCFAGDLAAAGRLLPGIDPGDYVALHDTGAYYFSNPFYYNALPAPAVYGIRLKSPGGIDFETWRKAQTLDDMLSIIG
jgi:diaminopimelate decarboxylase